VNDKEYVFSCSALYFQAIAFKNKSKQLFRHFILSTNFIKFSSNFVSSVCCLYHSSRFLFGFGRISTILGMFRFFRYFLLFLRRKLNVLFPLLATVDIRNVMSCFMLRFSFGKLQEIDKFQLSLYA